MDEERIYRVQEVVELARKLVKFSEIGDLNNSKQIHDLKWAVMFLDSYDKRVQ